MCIRDRAYSGTTLRLLLKTGYETEAITKYVGEFEEATGIKAVSYTHLDVYKRQAWDRGEHEEDIYCIAAPIFDFSKKVIASISVSVTIKYTPVEKLASYEDLLKEAALIISKNLGYVQNKMSK